MGSDPLDSYRRAYPDYEIEREIGRGAMGLVLRAIYKRLGRKVALKVINPQLMDRGGLARFKREAMLYGQLSHPNLVQVIDANPAGPVPYIALDLLDGTDLRTLLQQGERLAALEIGRDLASALAYIHAKDILHRDIKPANIMILSDGRPVLMDFGIAKSMSTDATMLTSDGMLVGTPVYMAPELIDSGVYGPEADVYALGLVLYELTGGRLEFDSSIRRVSLVPGPQEHPPRPVRARLDELVASCVQADRRKRPTAQALFEGLDELGRSEQTLDLSELPPELPEPPPRPARPPRLSGPVSVPVQLGTPRWNVTRWTTLAVVLGGFLFGAIGAHLIVGRPVARPPSPTATPRDPSPTAARPAPPDAASPQEIVGKDGAPMVAVPAGWFEMGYAQGDPEEQPVHKVYLDAFLIDKYEVTNERYQAFMAATGHRPPRRFPELAKQLEAPDHPVVGVEWEDAAAYAAWAGKRLPTEAEWEKAARGTDGRLLTWGRDLTMKNRRANYADRSFTRKYSRGNQGELYDIFSIVEVDDGYVHTAPVGSYPLGASPCGALDMAGNVNEWCSDWFDPTYYGRSPARNPTGPPTGETHVFRGGGWATYRIGLRASVRFRMSMGDGMDGKAIGFRCAMSATGP